MTTMTKIEMPNVEVLRKTGYKVRVYHGRTYLRCETNERFNTPEIIHEYMSKREYEHFNKEVRSVDWELSCKGGFTIVEITTPDGRDLRGKFNVPSGGMFNRKLGVKIATNRALKSGV
jgi:hypothetical protein